MSGWKATRPDGTDWHTGRIDYGSAVGSVLDPGLSGEGPFPGSGWLHLATVPTECAGMSWPCRLFEVAPLGLVVTAPGHPHKVGCTAVRVVREVDACLALGPQGRQVAALIARAQSMTADDVAALDAAWAAAGDAALDAAWAAAWAAARDAARDAAWAAAGDAAGALITRDLIPTGHYAALAGPWAAVMGWPHPGDRDDEEDT